LIAQRGVPELDRAVSDFLHRLASPGLDAFMNAATNLGSTAVLALVVAIAAVVLPARRRPREALFVVIALVGSLWLNDQLKQFFHRPRPIFDWAIPPPETGFPSGHSMNSFVVYVTLALVVWRVRGRRTGIRALAVAIALALTVGISRIYLGAHWFSDVIGAYLAGALWVLILLAAFGLPSWIRERPPSAREA
jgi:undecaprenyl-diphosphatase